MNDSAATANVDARRTAVAAPIRVLVVDDHAAFRAAAAQFLGVLPQVCLVGEAADGAEALRLTEDLAPDLVLMDLSMPVMDGLEATRAIKARARRAPRILIVTLYDGAACHAAALHAGADGLVAKSDLIGQLPPLLRSLFSRP